MSKTYTITCSYADWYSKTVTVEAETLDEALQLAYGDESDFKSYGFAGDTVVDSIKADGEEVPVPIQHADEDVQLRAVKEVLNEMLKLRASIGVCNVPLWRDLWDKAEALMKELTDE